MGYNEEDDEWETMYGKHSRVGAKSLGGLKRKIAKLESERHDAMLSFFSKGGYDRRGGSPEWEHYGD